jgi:hypothetical protein
VLEGIMLRPWNSRDSNESTTLGARLKREVQAREAITP